MAAHITVDDLLLHCSGVFSFQNDKTLRTENGYLPPQRLLDTAAKHRPYFCPGIQWYYSNTGYLMLGLIAEAIDGLPLQGIVQKRVAIPFGLSSLRFVSTADPQGIVVGPASQRPNHFTSIASIHGAGVIIAGPKDMIRRRVLC